MSKWQSGKVHWFDDASGEGAILGEDGESYYVHYSTIQSSKSKRTPTLSKPKSWLSLKNGKNVKFRVYENAYSKRVEAVYEV